MSTALTREQGDLRDAVADLMAKRSPESEVRRLMAGETGYDPAVWSRTRRDGTARADHSGGVRRRRRRGRRVGRGLRADPGVPCCAHRICPPRYSRRICLSPLTTPPSRRRAAPDRRGDVAHRSRVRRSRIGAAAATPGTAAVESSGAWRLTGEKTYVLDAGAAERLYVLAHTDSGTAVSRWSEMLPASPLRH